MPGMVTVKFVGGAKKSFSTDMLELDADGITIEKLLELILSKKPQNTPDLDVRNILVAINGADSSALEGKMTVVKNSDLISIIPVIHGGAPKKLEIQSGKNLIHVMEIKGNEKINVAFLDRLREDFPKIKLQAVSSKFVLNPYHLQKVLEISINSEKQNVLLSNRIETDILMRFALTKQIADAIASAGIKPKTNVVLIAIGSKQNLEKLYRKLTPNITQPFANDNSAFLKRHFKISKKHLDCVYSKHPLEDILIEKAAVLL